MAELNDSIVNVLTLSYSLNLQKFPCDYQRKHFPEYNVTSIKNSIYNRLLLNILYVINQKYGLNL